MNEHSPIGIMLAEADLLNADEFESTWLDSRHNRLRRDPTTR